MKDDTQYVFAYEIFTLLVNEGKEEASAYDAQRALGPVPREAAHCIAPAARLAAEWKEELDVV